MGTERKADQNPIVEVEVTPEMIEAGRAVLLSEISVWFGPDYNSAEVAEKVFRAMFQACRSSC
jgi:hypothetical protein